MRLVVQFRFKGLLWSNVCCISRNWQGWILSKHLRVLSCRKGGICWSVVLRSKLRERFDKITRCSLKIQQCIYRVRSLGGVGRRSRLGTSSRGSISAHVTKVALCSQSAAQTGCGHSGTCEILCTGASWEGNAEMESGMGWSKWHIKGNHCRSEHESFCTALPTSAITKKKQKPKCPSELFWTCWC